MSITTLKPLKSKVQSITSNEPSYPDYDCRRSIRKTASEIRVACLAQKTANINKSYIQYVHTIDGKHGIRVYSGFMGETSPTTPEQQVAVIQDHLIRNGVHSSLFRVSGNPTIGCDPEIFITENNKIRPFHYTLQYKQGTGRIINDGFAAEFTPCSKSCLAYLTDNVQAALYTIYNTYLKPYNKANNCKWEMNPIDYLPTPRVLRMSVPHKVVELGCKPSMNAYNDTVEFRDGIDTPYRTTGSHMHFGTRESIVYTPIMNDSEAINELVRWVDAIAGVWSVALLPSQSPKRRKLYGRAGEYRLPRHGIEYRTHTSLVHSHPAIYHLMFEITRSAFQLGAVGLSRVFKFSPSKIKSIINNVKVEDARALIKEHSILYKGMIQHLGTVAAETAYKVAMRPKGIEEFLPPTPAGIINGWQLEPNSSGRNGWHTHSDGPGKTWTAQASIINKKL